MITSKLTGKTYDPSECIFMSNPTQCAKYCKFLGTDLLVDVIVSSEKREDALALEETISEDFKKILGF